MFKMQTVVRLVIQKVMYENDIDAFVNPENTLPHRKIGGASEPTADDRNGERRRRQRRPDVCGHVYEPGFALSADKTRYNYVSGTQRSLLPRPMPISMMLWSGPGEEPVLIKIASAYEAATKHRVPPPDFGPLPEGQ